jgi:uncharacterized protein with FMN-binding domain
MITLVLRWKANLPEGVLFSILLMNMLTPAIDKFMSGNQIKDAAKLRNNTLITACLCMLVTLGVGLTLEPKADVNEIPDVADVIPVSSRTGIGDEELDAEAACQITENVGSKVVLSCSSKGFEGVNEATITIEDGAITSYEVTAFKDTVGVGDAAVTDDALSRYKGLTLQKSVDVTSGATFTSTSVKAMAQKALKIAAGEAEESAPISDGGADASAAKTLGDEKFSKNEAACEMTDNAGSKASFNCSAKGYEGVNEATVVIEDGKVTEVTVTAFNDTEGVGDAAVSEAALEKYKGVDLSSSVDVTSGASNTSKSIKAMVQKALTIYEGE